jgi:hypothetical protein
MKFTIEKREGSDFGCRDEEGKYIKLDLFTDSSFPESDTELNGKTYEEQEVYCNSLIGRQIEVESTSPYIPCYFANGVKFVTPQKP